MGFGTELLFVVALGLVVLETLRRSLGHTKMSATLEIYTLPVAQAQRQAAENLSGMVTSWLNSGRSSRQTIRNAPGPYLGSLSAFALILPAENGKASFRKPTPRQLITISELPLSSTYVPGPRDHMDVREADCNCRVVPKAPESQHLRGLPRRVVSHEVHLTNK